MNDAPAGNTSGVPDRWAAGDAYESFMGRWSRPLALRFVEWIGVPAGAHWLDVGCGTGALAAAVVQAAEPASVTGCDPAAPLLEHARRDVRDPRATFVAAAAGALPSRAGGYDAIASLLALNFMPDPAAALAEMRGLAAPNGVVAACVWDYAEGMGFLRRFWDAASDLDPEAEALDEGVRFPLARRDALEAGFAAAGFAGVRCEPLEVPTPFADFDDFWRPFLGGTGPAPSYVAALEPARRTALRARLEASLPRDAHGAVPLLARAWAVRGSVA